MIANMTLDGLESLLKVKFPRRFKVHFIRYADDFIITADKPERLTQEIKPLVQQFLRQRGLTLSPDKTSLTHIDEGFEFLGQHLRKYNGKLLVKPAPTSIQQLMMKLRRLIKSHPQVTAGQLIALLNPIIRGWVNYHRHAASKATFKYIDHHLHQAIWQWAKRRHPHKPKQWIYNKYFTTLGQRHWIFQGELTNPARTSQPIHLFKAASLSIKRHIKIKAQANPYDLTWEMYFEKRLDWKMAQELKGKGMLLYLWRKQKGSCPVCHQKITKQTSWHSHHLVWRTHGGGDEADNRVLLQPNCHRQVHNLVLDGVKLRLL